MNFKTLALAAAISATFVPAAFADMAAYRPVTDANVLNPEAGEWLMWRRTVDNQAYSPLEQVNTKNVGELRMEWSWSLPVGGLTEVAPLVRDGVMFVGMNRAVVQALDATNGNLIWEYKHKNPEWTGGYHASQADRQRNNIVLYKDKVYLTTPDAKIVALDAKTGKSLWESQVADWKKGFSYTAGAMVVNGLIYTGMSGCSIADTGGGCFIMAHDAETGKEVWRVNTLSDLTRKEVEASWNGIPPENRYGGSAWITGAYDAKRDTLFWGVGMPIPWAESVRGTTGGATLYTNSTLAIDAKTGKVKWYYQHLGRDDWDLDSVFERVLVESEIAPEAKEVRYMSAKVKPGKKYDVIVTVPGKYGTAFVLDRDSGDLLWARDTAYQNVVKGFTKDGKSIPNADLISKTIDQTVHVCGGRSLGKLWQAGAYSPKTNSFYFPMAESCRDLTPNPGEYVTGGALGFQKSGPAQAAPGETNTGRFYAFNVKTGKMEWVKKQAALFTSSALTTAGDLVFVGDSMRNFTAFEQASGKLLWNSKLNTSVSGNPMTYSVNGKQYIAITTGPHAQTPTAVAVNPELKNVNDSGHSLFVFALPDAKPAK